jgi:hypothetical protein
VKTRAMPLSRIKSLEMEKHLVTNVRLEFWTTLMASIQLQLEAVGCTCDPVVQLEKDPGSSDTLVRYDHDGACASSAGRARGETWTGKTIDISPGAKA